MQVVTGMAKAIGVSEIRHTMGLSGAFSQIKTRFLFLFERSRQKYQISFTLLLR